MVLDLGVKIYEHTPMVALGRTRPPTVNTPYGTITAGKVVLGLYGWSLALPELNAGAMVIFSDAVMTEALPDELDSLGWREGPGLMDSRTFVEGYRATADGRVFWSKAGGALPYGGRMEPHMNQTTRSLESMRNVMRAVYPTLADRPILGTWGGTHRPDKKRTADVRCLAGLSGYSFWLWLLGCRYELPGKGATFRSLPPLRTVRESFPSHRSSLSRASDLTRCLSS